MEEKKPIEVSEEEVTEEQVTEKTEGQIESEEELESAAADEQTAGEGEAAAEQEVAEEESPEQQNKDDEEADDQDDEASPVLQKRRLFVKEFCKYEFTPKEKRDLSEEMARKTLEREDVEIQKKSAMASFKDKIEKLNLEIRQCATKVRDGFEMKDVECEVIRDYENGVVIQISCRQL